MKKIILTLPDNINQGNSALRIHLAPSLRVEKLPAGPMVSPSPGPILATAVAAPETAVMKSSPVRANAQDTIPSVTTKNMKNEITELSTSLSTARPS